MGGRPSGRPCLQDGCTGTVIAWDMCEKHYRRWRKHGDPAITQRAGGGNLQAHVEATAPRLDVGPCHTAWPFRTRMKGRPALRVNGVKVQAIRYAYFVITGEWANQINHTCHNDACWNPHHGYPGDNHQNNLDMVRAGRAWRQDTITREQAGEIVRRYTAGGISQQALADEFGCSQILISRIVRGTHWTTRPD